MLVGRPTNLQNNWPQANRASGSQGRSKTLPVFVFLQKIMGMGGVLDFKPSTPVLLGLGSRNQVKTRSRRTGLGWALFLWPASHSEKRHRQGTPRLWATSGAETDTGQFLLGGGAQPYWHLDSKLRPLERWGSGDFCFKPCRLWELVEDILFSVKPVCASFWDSITPSKPGQ